MKLMAARWSVIQVCPVYDSCFIKTCVYSSYYMIESNETEKLSAFKRLHKIY